MTCTPAELDAVRDRLVKRSRRAWHVHALADFALSSRPYLLSMWRRHQLSPAEQARSPYTTHYSTKAMARVRWTEARTLALCLAPRRRRLVADGLDDSPPRRTVST